MFQIKIILKQKYDMRMRKWELIFEGGLIECDRKRAIERLVKYTQQRRLPN
jgi:hypothetical protein